MDLLCSGGGESRGKARNTPTNVAYNSAQVGESERNRRRGNIGNCLLEEDVDIVKDVDDSNYNNNNNELKEQMKRKMWRRGRGRGRAEQKAETQNQFESINRKQSGRNCQLGSQGSVPKVE